MRRSSLLILLISLALTLSGTGAYASGPGTTVPGATDDPFSRAPTQAASTADRGTGFTFYGSGYGHGLGMSQWGAYGLALQGWSYRRILTHFYRNTRIERPASPVRHIRVGLTYDRTLLHLTAKGGPVRLWIGRPHGHRVGRIPGGATWTVRPKASGFAVRDQGDKLVGGHPWGGASFDLFATYADSGSRVFIPEADAIWGVGFSYARGYVEFNLYHHGGGLRERAILPIAFEQYLYGIGEVPSSWPREALRSQAVAARTFATYTVRHYALRKECNCDLTDGVNDQTYVGASKESGSQGKRWVNAVDDTRGRIVTYKGNVIQAFFAASDGGHSDSVEDVWHGGNPTYAVPYLKAECDPGEWRAPKNPWRNWQRVYSASETTSRLAPYTGGIGTVRGFQRIKRGDGGRIISARIKGGTGSATISGTELRSALSAWDDRLWVNKNKNVLGPIRRRYDDLMCRPGLPTSPVTSVPGGSRQKFQTGGIFRNAGADVTVWLKGSIYREFMAVHGVGGRLGLPTSKIGSVTGSGGGTVGQRVTFEGGRIYAKAKVGAHALWGKVLGTYLDRSGPTGSLGFPTSRVHGDGSGGSTASFQHGTITCPDAGGCTVS
jgi:SpoIID/LytB domain protein